MKRVFTVIVVIAIWIVSVGAERNEPLQNDGHIDFEAAGFQKMSSTAYCMGHHTADGSPVHEGGCACSPDHIGDIAVIYTLEGNFLGYYICNDTGANGVYAGTVIDIYRCNLTRCRSYMKVIGPEQKVYVKWISGEG